MILKHKLNYMGSIKLIIKILKTHELRWDQSRTNINDFKI